MGEPLDHCPAGRIRQSRKCCIQPIHNHRVVDFLGVSSTHFAISRQCTHRQRLISISRQYVPFKDPYLRTLRLADFACPSLDPFATLKMRKALFSVNRAFSFGPIARPRPWRPRSLTDHAGMIQEPPAEGAPSEVNDRETDSVRGSLWKSITSRNRNTYAKLIEKLCEDRGPSLGSRLQAPGYRLPSAFCTTESWRTKRFLWSVATASSSSPAQASAPRAA